MPPVSGLKPPVFDKLDQYRTKPLGSTGIDDLWTNPKIHSQRFKALKQYWSNDLQVQQGFTPQGAMAAVENRPMPTLLDQHIQQTEPIPLNVSKPVTADAMPIRKG